ncbi:MATE family efflux transporter [Gordonia desulfuricans]|uniref:Probable multidrug resistance protein NorM n=2 Tax=Gordonia desulfuricans TaxID=89051 RepID=A0A7K3LJ91_9ACTN|nr:MATE family efflux transporter [Gordonia desulfuricans]NDK88294.1 MATE family efflux transporter [Gordonia desulfuricans]
MTYRRTGRELVGLSAPIALTQLAQVALTTTDLAMMGLISTEALAAGGLAITLFNQVRTMGVGLITAVGNLVAHAVGRHGRACAADGARAIADGPDATDVADEIRDIVRSSFLIATLAGIAGGVVLVALGMVLRVVGVGATVAEPTMWMLVALAPGLLPCLWFQVIRQFTVGMRRPKALLLITVVSMLINIALNWMFIHGTFGMPALGLTGIGLSTSLVYLVTFVIIAIVVRRDRTLAPIFGVAVHRSQASTVRRILRLGTPIAGTYGSEAGLFTVAAIIIGGFGAPALAAHNVVNQLTYIVFQVSVGISHGSSILVSRFVGLGTAVRSRTVAIVAYSHAAVVVGAVGVVYLLAPNAVLGLFTDISDDAVMSVATVLLAIAVFQQFVDSAQNIGIGLLCGVQDTTSSFAITLIGYWVVGLPVGLILAYGLGLETTGIWVGLSCGLLIAALLLLRTFRRRLAVIESRA